MRDQLADSCMVAGDCDLGWGALLADTESRGAGLNYSAGLVGWAWLKRTAGHTQERPFSDVSCHGLG